MAQVAGQDSLADIDDWGLENLAPAHRNDLLEIMDDCHAHASTIVVSQLPTDQWYASIGDNTLADAILGPANARRAATRTEGRIDAEKTRQVDPW